MPNVSHMLTVATLATGLGTDSSLDAVRRAQGLLESRTWTQIVQIENTSAASRYPRVVPALIFQLDSVLWFYTPTDGTQSLSRLRNHAEADKLELAPLLASIDGGFTRWTVVPRLPLPVPPRGRLPKGCFIESMALLFQRMDSGTAVENPKLLSYYVALPGGMRGHTVLQYTAGGRIQVIDPDRPRSTLRVRSARDDDPAGVAGCIRGDVTRARHLPLGEFLDRAPVRFYATLPAQTRGSYDPQNTDPAPAPRSTRS